MANPQQLSVLKNGVRAWNDWLEEHFRCTHPATAEYFPDLSDADFSNADLYGANLHGVDLNGAILVGANLESAILEDAYLRDAELRFANLQNCRLQGAHLERANLDSASLHGADLRRSNLSAARLTSADLRMAVLVHSDLTRANISNSWVYGASVWDVTLEGTIQDNLIITPRRHVPTVESEFTALFGSTETHWADSLPQIEVDSLEIAQFMYLLLRNDRLRGVIESMSSKVVLILGRFTTKRRRVLEHIRDSIRSAGYIPVLFDFEGPSSRDVTETVSTLAHLARFVIVDLTSARSVPQELSMIVPNLPSVPVQPIIRASETPYDMFGHWCHYPWVLPVLTYGRQEEVLDLLPAELCSGAEAYLTSRRA